jgi:parallel beta-helix repeat protein
VSTMTIFALAVFVVALELVAPARAAAVACGDALTESVTLDADLGCGTDGGLIVFADDITIDLAGHAIGGVGGGNGVDNTLGFDRVTIKNGRIDGFENGILLNGGEEHSIRNMTVKGGSSSGIVLGAGVRSSKIQKTSVGNTLGAAIIIVGDDNLVSQVTVVDAGGVGIQISGNGNTVAKSTVAYMRSNGIATFGTSSGNVFTGNVLSANAETGIALLAIDGGTGNRVTKNVCEGNELGGIRLVNADAGVVAGNRVVGNGFNGILIGPSADGNQVTKNVVTANHGSGIVVTGDSLGTVLTANVASRNRLVGISSGSSATIGKNTADANSVRGIEAPIGVVDAGGNKARNNSGENCTAAIFCK